LQRKTFVNNELRDLLKAPLEMKIDERQCKREANQTAAGARLEKAHWRKVRTA
jgi:hypothetical protein